ncbi:MAG TPA: hypothetical protein VL371_11735 [Gemmataceae bacterium]|jgi:hypothetical protein|nr:hypothetical protein [Gemmataceae bacterium]
MIAFIRPTSIAFLTICGAFALAQSPAPRPTLQQLEARAAGLLPTKDQLRYQEIPWVHDLAEAQKVARAERRPIFLWGYGGRARPDNGLEGC